MLKKKYLTNKVVSQRMQLYKLAYSWTHQKALAEDLVHEAIEKALRNISSLKEVNALSAWLRRILVNTFRNHLSRQKEHQDIDSILLVDNRTPEHQLHTETLRMKIRHAISNLPLGQRMAITLVDLEERTYTEVADILDVPIGTIMSRLCRARRQLAKQLKNEYALKSNIHIIK